MKEQMNRLNYYRDNRQFQACSLYVENSVEMFEDS